MGRVVLGRGVPRRRLVQPWRPNGHRRAPLVGAIAIAAAFAGAGYLLLGSIAAVVFLIFLLGSLAAWLATTYGRPADPRPMVVPYLLAVMLFFVHVAEEYYTGFWQALADLTGRPVSEMGFLAVAGLIGPVFWLAGLLLLYRRAEIGNYLAWAFVLAMSVSELAHFVFPFMADGPLGYFPGLYTAVLPLIPATYVGFLLVRDSRRESVHFPVPVV
jgi:hypothetical protein